MKQYLLRRLVICIPVLIGISMFTFAMVAFAPGNAVTAMINPESAGLLGPDWVKQQEEKLGLHDPIPIRYLRWSEQIETHDDFAYGCGPATLRARYAAFAVAQAAKRTRHSREGAILGL